MAVGGTSASTPAFAGLVSLMNEARAQAGKKPLGFLNPFIYQNADCFTDITKGTNAIGRGNGPIAYGFAAAPGWDPATVSAGPGGDFSCVTTIMASHSRIQIIFSLPNPL